MMNPPSAIRSIHRRPAAGALAAVTLALSACATGPRPAATAPASTLAGVAWEATGARHDEVALTLRLRAGEREVYARSNWPDPAPSSVTALGERMPVATLEALGRDPDWEPSADGETIRVLSADDWIDFRTEFLRSITPTEAGFGNVIDFSDEEFFFYYDAEGVFQSVRIQNKPATVRIRRTYTIGTAIRLASELLAEYLFARGIGERAVVFNTGETGSLPFVYGNLDTGTTLFLRLDKPEPAVSTQRLRTQQAQVIGHVTLAGSRDLLVRPVTSVRRLLFAAAGAGGELLKSKSVTRLRRTAVAPLWTGEGMDLVGWERRLDKLTGQPASSGTLHYFVDGSEYFPQLLDALIAAEKSIQMRTYIFDNDDYAIKIGNILKKRSNEDVDVKLLLDGLGTIIATRVDPETLPIGHETPPSVRRFLQADSRIRIRQTANPWLTGDHVKTTIIDERLAFVGGMNIGREYRYEWHDLMMAVRGPVVDELRLEFERVWALAGRLGDLGYLAHRLRSRRHESGVPGGHAIRVLHTRPGQPHIFRAQIEAIRTAKRYIYIQNAYLSDDAILYELVAARRRGVDVRVIMPMRGNHGPLNKSNALAANTMLQNGIRVFIYPGMSHVKAAVYDGWACLGSANFDKLSFRVNREINLATSDADAVQELLERVFHADFQLSPELTEPFPVDWSHHLAEIVADFLL